MLLRLFFQLLSCLAQPPISFCFLALFLVTLELVALVVDCAFGCTRTVVVRVAVLDASVNVRFLDTGGGVIIKGLRCQWLLTLSTLEKPPCGST